MNMRKWFSVMLALSLCAPLFAAGKIRIAPGASCYAWNVNTKSKPDSVPNGGFVDESEIFSSQNIYKCDELKNFEGGCFIMWEGFLQVPKNGRYRFTFTTESWVCEQANIKIFLNSSALLTRVGGREKTVTSAVELKRGFVKLRVYFNPQRWGRYENAIFKLKFAPVNAMKMTDITPATLYHQVEDEN